MNFDNTLCIMKILDLKILVLHVFSVSLFKYFKPVSNHHQMENFLVPFHPVL